MRVVCLLLPIAIWPSSAASYSMRENSLPLKSLECNKEFVGVSDPYPGAKVFANKNHTRTGFTRRNAISRAFFTVGAITLFSAKEARAACLMGDTSPDCIGIYKVPMDDAALGYIDTPEKLRLNAPDLRWVPPVQYPKTYKDARAELNSLRQRCITLNDLVLKGNLTEAGTELLGITPRVTVAGRVVIQNLREAPNSKGDDDMSMKAFRAEVAHTELLSRLAQADLLLGQAIAGQLGATAPAQIQILAEVREANAFFDELMQVIPDDLKGGQKKTR